MERTNGRLSASRSKESRSRSLPLNPPDTGQSWFKPLAAPPTLADSTRFPLHPASPASTPNWACPGAAGLREQPFRGQPPKLVDLADVRGDLHCHTTWSDGKNSVLEMALRSDRARLRVHRYLRPHPERPRRSRARRRRPPTPRRRDRRRQRASNAVSGLTRHREWTSAATANSTSATTCSRNSTGCNSASTPDSETAATT